MGSCHFMLMHPQGQLPKASGRGIWGVFWYYNVDYMACVARLCLFVCTLMCIKSQCVTSCLPLFTLCGLTHVIFWPQMQTNVNNSHHPRPSMGITPRPKMEGQAGLCQIWPKSISWAAALQIAKSSNLTDI